MTDQKPEHNSIKERAKKKLERDMGPELLAALNDPKTVEIMLNADGKLWLERLGEPMKCIGTLRVAQAQAIIETWRMDYNHHRPHSSLGHLTPDEFVAQRQEKPTVEEAVCSG